jgi:hypothetical protein
MTMKKVFNAAIGLFMGLGSIGFTLGVEAQAVHTCYWSSGSTPQTINDQCLVRRVSLSNEEITIEVEWSDGVKTQLTRFFDDRFSGRAILDGNPGEWWIPNGRGIFVCYQSYVSGNIICVPN